MRFDDFLRCFFSFLIVFTVSEIELNFLFNGFNLLVSVWNYQIPGVLLYVIRCLIQFIFLNLLLFDRLFFLVFLLPVNLFSDFAMITSAGVPLYSFVKRFMKWLINLHRNSVQGNTILLLQFGRVHTSLSISRRHSAASYWMAPQRHPTRLLNFQKTVVHSCLEYTWVPF